MSFWCNCQWKLSKFALSTFRKCQIGFCSAPILDKNLSSSLFLKICIATLCLWTGGGQKEITYIFIFCLCVVSTKSWLFHLSFFAQKKSVDLRILRHILWRELHFWISLKRDQISIVQKHSFAFFFFKEHQLQTQVTISSNSISVYSTS